MSVVVGYFSDAFSKSERYGLSRYSHELWSNVSSRPGVELLPLSSRNESLDLVDGRDPATGFRKLPLSRAALSAAWASVNWPPVEMMAREASLIHAVDIDYAVSTRLPIVYTVHDLGPILYPEFFGQSRPWLLKAMLASIKRRADAVICVSQTTADDLGKLLGTEIFSRTTVIPHGISSVFSSPVPGDQGDGVATIVGDRPYFLFSGSLNPRKNLPAVLDAFSRVKDEIPHSLVITGSSGWGGVRDDLVERARELGDRLILAGYVDDATLAQLYRSATAYLYVSLFEGFGLPILEAMASGCPVITSNLSSMPEVAGNAALLVDPHETGAIAEAMLTIARDGQKSAELVELGRNNAAKYSWDEAGLKTVAVYEKIIAGGGRS